MPITICQKKRHPSASRRNTGTCSDRPKLLEESIILWRDRKPKDTESKPCIQRMKCYSSEIQQHTDLRGQHR